MASRPSPQAAVAMRITPVMITRRRNSRLVLRVFFTLSAMMIALQSVINQQAIESHQIRYEKRSALYPRSIPGSPYEAVPEYARRLFKDTPDLSSQVHEYLRFGKATAIARFRSTYPKYRVTILKNKDFKVFKHPMLFDTTYNGNITIHHINKNAYMRANSKYLYISSALFRDNRRRSATNKTVYYKPKKENSVRKPEQEIIFTGWIQENLSNATLLCCFLRDNSTVVSYDNIKRLIWTQVKKQELLAGKVFCPIPPDIGRNQVIGAGLSLPRDRCRKETFMSIENVGPMDEGSIGICAKILYGAVEPDRLVEWLEIQKHIEVDKVLLYVYNLDAQAVQVVKHYTEEGFVDMIPFDYPMALELERHVGEKVAMAFIDEQVVVFDCMERLRGYTYAAIMDVDEILYAKAARFHSLKSLTKKLNRQYPKAAGFTFKTEIFITDWPTLGESDTNMFWHTKFQNRTRPMIDRPKNLLKLDKIVLGSVWTHNYTVKAGYERYMVPANIALVKHYRPCRENWGCDQRRGYIDKSIVRIVTNIGDNIHDKLDQLGLPYRDANTP